MVYAICYCPLSRLADLEALKVAGELVLNVCTLGSWVRAGGQVRYRGNGKNHPLPFSSTFLLRLKDLDRERAGEALCENGGGRRLCGLGFGHPVSKPDLYQHAWAVRGPVVSGGRATHIRWQRPAFAMMVWTKLCPSPQGQVQPQLPVTRHGCGADTVCAGSACQCQPGELWPVRWSPSGKRGFTTLRLGMY